MSYGTSRASIPLTRPPEEPELRIATVELTPESAAELILEKLVEMGILPAEVIHS